MNFIETMNENGWVKADVSEKLRNAPYSSTWRKGPVRVELAHAEIHIHKGYVNYYDACSANWWVISAIVVDESSRFQKLGTTTLHELISIAKDLEATKIYLEATPMRKYGSILTREQLRAWYLRHGFVDQKDGNGIILEMQLGAE